MSPKFHQLLPQNKKKKKKNILQKQIDFFFFFSCKNKWESYLILSALDEENMVLGAKSFMASWQYLKLTLSEENGSVEWHIGLQFRFISHITRTKLSKAWMLLTVYAQWMFIEMQYLSGS